jgi:predicted outer membrane repeat protein
VNVGRVKLDRSFVRENRAGGSGGGIYNLGKIYPNGGRLELTRSVVTQNRAGAGGGIANEQGAVSISGGGSPISRVSQNRATYGGGIYTDGILSVDSTVLASNRAANGGAFANGYGGNLSVTKSIVTRNRAKQAGGALWNDYGGFDITGSTLSENIAGFGGGGISTSAKDVPSTITASTLSGNQSRDGGGGIAVLSGPVTILNSTLSHNTSESSSGGGLYVEFDSAVDVSWTTFLGNDSGDANGILDGGAIFSSSNGAVTAHNTIVASSRGSSTSMPMSNCGGGMISGSNNLSDTSGCGNPAFFVGPTGLNSSLASNGGSTWTHALMANTTPPGVACPAKDQRGYLRPSTLCDIGAYEF